MIEHLILIPGVQSTLFFISLSKVHQIHKLVDPKRIGAHLGYSRGNMYV